MNNVEISALFVERLFKTAWVDLSENHLTWITSWTSRILCTLLTCRNNSSSYNLTLQNSNQHEKGHQHTSVFLSLFVLFVSLPKPFSLLLLPAFVVNVSYLTRLRGRGMLSPCIFLSFMAGLLLLIRSPTSLFWWVNWAYLSWLVWLHSVSTLRGFLW